ncbi:MAG TPA: four helix bundle protein [Sedimenticola sp.]|nr:four helix bundle protein [Sedimenticola sp.]
MQDFKDLLVWQKAHKFVLTIYQMSNSFPRDEVYGLTSQLRRSSASIPANIAEACGRDGSKEFARFLQIAMGSASETEYHLLLARDLGFINVSSWDCMNSSVIEIKRMLAALLKKVRSNNSDH